jgi:hypothetical protein
MQESGSNTDVYEPTRRERSSFWLAMNERVISVGILYSCSLAGKKRGAPECASLIGMLEPVRRL